MALQTFTAGQVLTAAQMNALQANDYNQTVNTSTTSYVLVASDKGTRRVMNAAGSTTITVNTSLFSAGDTLILQNIGAGVCTVTAGTATVSTAGSLAIPQNGSGILYFTSAGVSIYYPSAVTTTAPGFVFIASASPSAVTSVSINNCFTSTYENYRIMFGATAASAGGSLSLRLRASAVDTTTNYASQFIETTSTTVASNSNGTGTDEWYLGSLNTPVANGFSIDVYRPQLAQKTAFTGIANNQYTAGTATILHLLGGSQTDATQFDGFTLKSDGITFTGKIYVYGYSNS